MTELINRIYQGNVKNIKIVNVETKDFIDADIIDLPEWREKLWAQHELFQDAVNYYVVALLALANNEKNPIYAIRNSLDEKDDSGNPTSRQVWDSFRRRGVTRQGMKESVVKYLCPNKPEASAEDCFKEILKGNKTSAQILNDGLLLLLDACKGGGGKLRNSVKEFFPLFCMSKTDANFKKDPILLKRAWAEKALPHILHNSATTFDSKELDQFGVHSIATPDNANPVISLEKATLRISNGLKFLKENDFIDKVQLDQYSKQVSKLPDDFILPGYRGTSARSREKMRQMAALLLFKYVSKNEDTFLLLQDAYSKPKENSIPPAPFDEVNFEDDPIKISRGERGYVFPAFTSLDHWSRESVDKTCSKNFDMHAMVNAVVAIHQVEEKGEERRKERFAKEYLLDCMENKQKWKKSSQSEEDAPPLLAGDPRISRLEELVDVEMVHEYEATEGESVAYGLQERTIRGFTKLREKWNLELDKNIEKPVCEIKPSLVTHLRNLQKEDPSIMGSSALFEELLKEKNWIIWKIPSEEEMGVWAKKAGLKGDFYFSENPLSDLTSMRQVKQEVLKLSEPISFTPADPRYSRRQLYFSELRKFSPKGEFKHLPNQMAVVVPLVIKTNDKLEWKRVIIEYSAPRLLRDRLRVGTNENLKQAPFLQPMMEALAGENLTFEQRKVVDHAVALMPEEKADGSKRFILNFPIDLNVTQINDLVGKKALWDKQLCTFDEKNIYLNWPSTVQDNKNSPEKWWWDSIEEFNCLGIDLGQRASGAFAVMNIKANRQELPSKAFREIGSSGKGSDSKVWTSELKECGLIRLPGEGNRKEGKELWGGRGRYCLDSEWEESLDFCEKFDQDTSKIFGGGSRKYSYPEVNDKLLVVLRRSQARLARFNSFGWKLNNSSTRQDAIKEIYENEEAVKILSLTEDLSRDILFQKIENESTRLKKILCEGLLFLANRILPLRGRRWEWVEHEKASGSHILRQAMPGTGEQKTHIMGQRGLSMARIEQLEELRRRSQALNRSLTHKFGKRPVFGRRGKGIELPDPCPEILQKLERLKKQRINQTAHDIVALALGVRLRSPQKSREIRKQRDIHGEYESFRCPVDFIVLEDLNRYLSSQGRSRNENSRLMKWCHRSVLAKVKMLAEPYGIPVIETNAAYSSRFCSRTGGVGFRAMELAPSAKDQWPWAKALEEIAETESVSRFDKKKRIYLERVKQTFESLIKVNEGREGKAPRAFVFPMPGGEIFVNSDGQTMQADINAAINLGLRAVCSPDAHLIQPRVRTKTVKKELQIRTDSKREKARWLNSTELITKDLDHKSLGSSTNPNLFIDVLNVADYGKLSAKGFDECKLASSLGLFGSLREKEWDIVRKVNEKRMLKWEYADDEIPM